MERTVKLGNGKKLPAIGIGAWHIGDNKGERAKELESIEAGLEAGARLIDTAEMYGRGKSEELVGEAVKGKQREGLYLVSKVLPENAGGDRLERALDASLKRLGTDYLDLYLYHWRGSYPLSETVSLFEKMKAKGKILDWGVSNFDIDDMEELWRIPQGKNCIVNQVLYHTASRGIEFSLLPWMEKNGVTLMSYCPLAQGGRLKSGLLKNPLIESISAKYNATPAQIILAWNIRKGNVIAIPKSSSKEHMILNMKAAEITLTEEDLRLIDSAYPAPVKKEWLDIQ